jgi:uncharacterized protein (TIGR02265 family)
MSSIRGVVFHSRFDYIHKHLDTAVFKRAGDKLSPQAKQVIFDQIFMVNKYPFAVLKEMDRILPEVSPLPGEDLFREIGQEFAYTILDRYFFNYIEAHKPHKFLAQLQKLYGNLWDFGQYEVRAEENQKAQITLSYEEEVYPEYTWFMEEFFKTGVEICNGKNVTLKRISDNSSNEEGQVYSISWK